MKLIYRFDQERILIRELTNENDTEFEIKIADAGSMLTAFKHVKKVFEEDKVFTDAMFYAFENHQYKVIVRKDFYVDFVLSLMGHQLLKSVEWVADTTE